MNRFLILGPNFPNINPAYRGIDRVDIPQIPEDINKAELLNKSIEKYFEARDLSVTDGEYLKDYQFALKIANSFTLNNDNSEVFEVVQVLFADETKPNHHIFLGYDVIGVSEHGSMIVDQLLRDFKSDGEYSRFNKLLNNNLLFTELHIAEEFAELIFRKNEIKTSLKIIGLYTR